MQGVLMAPDVNTVGVDASAVTAGCIGGLAETTGGVNCPAFIAGVVNGVTSGVSMAKL